MGILASNLKDRDQSRQSRQRSWEDPETEGRVEGKTDPVTANPTVLLSSARQEALHLPHWMPLKASSEGKRRERHKTKVSSGRVEREISPHSLLSPQAPVVSLPALSVVSVPASPCLCHS